MPEAIDYLLLRYIPRLGKAGVKKLFAQDLSPRQIWERYKDKVENVGLAREESERELKKAEALGIRILTFHDVGYPPRLKEIYDPPVVLYVKGDILPQDELALAVVGTRTISGYGREVIKMLVPSLCASGLTIVSGLARGADSLAHETALAAGGRTIAVLGSGLDIIYPPENRQLFERITRQGATISEFPLGFEPERFSFPVRNRLISGISLGVWVIEAPEKSGALITAACALEHNREVFALPGSIFAQTSLGTNRLIEQGATLVTKAEDIVGALNLEMKKAGVELRDYLPQTDLERKILGILTASPCAVEELVRQLGLPAAEVGGAVSTLEIKGVIREVSQGEYRVV